MDQAVNPADWGAVPERDPSSDPELDASIRTASTSPIKPTKYNLYETRSPKQILEDEKSAKAALKPVAQESPAAWGAKPAEEPAPKKGFVKELKESLSTIDLRNNFFVRATEIANENLKYKQEIKGSPEWKSEAQKMRQEHPEYTAMQADMHMQQWLAEEVGKRFKAARGDVPKEGDKPLMEMGKELVKAAYDHPGLVLGELIKSVAEDPELLLPVNWELGLARSVDRVGSALKFAANVRKGATAVARTAEVGGGMAAIQAPISATEQYQKTGEVDTGKVVKEAELVALTGATLHATIKLVSGSIKQKTGKTVLPEDERAAAGEIEKRMQGGQSVDDAAKAVFTAMGLPENDAAEVAAKLKETTHAEGDQSGQVLPEAQKQGEGPSSKDMPVIDRPIAEDRKAPEEKVAPSKESGKVIRPQQFQPLPEGVPSRFVTPEEARAIYEMAGVDPEAAAGMAGKMPIAMGALRQRLTKFMGGQKYADSTLVDAVKSGKLKGQSGQIDPWLVKYLGAVSLGGAGAYVLTGDRDKVIGTAVAIGALPLAAKVAGKVGDSMRSIFDRFLADKSFHADEPFRAFNAQKDIIEHAVTNWGKSVDALLTGVPDRNASRIKVRDWLQGHRDVPLTPQEQVYADEIRKFLDKVGSQAHDVDAIRNLRENYLTGLYQKAPFKKWTDILRELATDDAYRGNYTGMSRNSRYNLQKVIPDYREAERLHAEGKFPLIPLTNDPVAIAIHYARSVQKTMSVRKLVNDLKSTPSDRLSKTGRAIPVIVGDTPFETAQRITAVNHRTGEKMGFPEERIEAQTRSQILNAPSDYVYIKHPSLEGLRVHGDIAPALKMLFDTSDPGLISRALYAASMAAKGLFFTVSLFHPWALLDVAGALALPRAKFLMSIPKYWKEIGGARQMLHTSEGAPEVARAAKAGVSLYRSVGDVDPRFIERTLNSMELLAGQAGKMAALPFKAMGEIHKWFHNFLWNEVHPTFKLAAFNAELKNWLLKNPTGDVEKASREIASGVNDMFGGQNWFDLSNTIPGKLSRTIAMSIFSPAGRRLQQTVFLSPDWNISAARAWYGGIKSVMPGIERKASDSMYRGYLVWSALTYLGAANFMSNAFTGKNIWDQKDWTYVQTGDGRKIQLNKHFMEMVHLWHNPVQFVTNKLNLIPREVLDQVMGKDWIAYDNTKQEFYGPPIDSSLVGRLEHAGKTMVPISIANIMRDPAAGMVTWLTGRPVYGETFAERDKQAIERAGERAKAKGKDEEKARSDARKRREKAARKREQEERVSQ